MHRWIITSPHGSVMAITATQKFALLLRDRGWGVIPA